MFGQINVCTTSDSTVIMLHFHARIHSWIFMFDEMHSLILERACHIVYWDLEVRGACAET
jgi:hypothetical protein